MAKTWIVFLLLFSSAAQAQLNPLQIWLERLFTLETVSPLAFRTFSKELTEMKFPAGFLSAAIATVDSIRVATPAQLGSAAAVFYQGPNVLVVSSDIYDPAAKQIRSLRQMGEVNASVLIHELWHGYYWSVFRKTNAHAKFLADAEATYTLYPRSKREEIHEESYGLYIQELSRVALSTRKILQNAPSREAREILRRHPVIRKDYQGAFTRPVYGYYQGGGLQYSKTALPQADKNFINFNLIKWNLTGQFDADFADVTETPERDKANYVP